MHAFQIIAQHINCMLLIFCGILRTLSAQLTPKNSQTKCSVGIPSFQSSPDDTSVQLVLKAIVLGMGQLVVKVNMEAVTPE